MIDAVGLQVSVRDKSDLTLRVTRQTARQSTRAQTRLDAINCCHVELQALN